MIKSKWTLTREIYDIVYSPTSYSKNGLILENREYAGTLSFENNNCRLIGDIKLCDKVHYNQSLVRGNGDNVATPMALVNFHTHPLQCYKDNKVIWGWPSGEDLAHCVRIAKDGNLYHVIFTVEGTFIIKVNVTEINEKTIQCLEEIFKQTHKYRWYKNMEDSSSLEEEFDNYIKISGMKPVGNGILEKWINFVNNFKLEHCAKYTKVKLDKNSNGRIYNMQFIPNDSVQFKLPTDQGFSQLLRINSYKDFNKLVKTPTSVTFSL